MMFVLIRDASKRKYRSPNLPVIVLVRNSVSTVVIVSAAEVGNEEEPELKLTGTGAYPYGLSEKSRLASFSSGALP